jgi:hypothetical protein
MLDKTNVYVRSNLYIYKLLLFSRIMFLKCVYWPKGWNSLPFFFFFICSSESSDKENIINSDAHNNSSGNNMLENNPQGENSFLDQTRVLYPFHTHIHTFSFVLYIQRDNNNKKKSRKKYIVFLRFYILFSLCRM